MRETTLEAGESTTGRPGKTTARTETLFVRGDAPGRLLRSIGGRAAKLAEELDSCSLTGLIGPANQISLAHSGIITTGGVPSSRRNVEKR